MNNVRHDKRGLVNPIHLHLNINIAEECQGRTECVLKSAPVPVRGIL
jgi:hypothetical protein